MNRVSKKSFWLSVLMAVFVFYIFILNTPVAAAPPNTLNVYTADPSVSNSGTTTTSGKRSVHDLVLLIGSSREAVIELPHTGSGVSTPYIFSTTRDYSAYTNIYWRIAPGAKFHLNAVNLTLADSGKVDALCSQAIVGSGTGSLLFATESFECPAWRLGTTTIKAQSAEIDVLSGVTISGTTLISENIQIELSGTTPDYFMQITPENTSYPFKWSYKNIPNLGNVPILSLNTDRVANWDIAFGDTPNGLLMWLWDSSGTAVPDLPHTGIKPTFAVYGDALLGDIIALESNPMTYFMRANSGVTIVSGTQLFSAKAMNNDTDGGAGIVMYPAYYSGVTGSGNDGYITYVAYGKGSGYYANSHRFLVRLGANSVGDAFYIKDKNVGITGGGTASFGNGSCVLFMSNAETVPSTNPTNGGVLYIEGGALKYRGSSGTVTQIALP